jgi:diguanylate cyclase (GGDEF)-like protein
MSNPEPVPRESAWLAAVTASLGAVVIAVDLRGTIIGIAGALRARLGVHEGATLVGTHLAGLIAPEELARARSTHSATSPRSDLDAILGTVDPLPTPGDWTFLSRDGGPVPMRLDWLATRGADGQVDGWIAVASNPDCQRLARSEHARVTELEAQLDHLRLREREAERIREAYTYLGACRSVREALTVLRTFLGDLFGAAPPQLLIPRADRDDGDADTLRPDSCWALKTGQIYVSEPGGLRCGHLPDSADAWACAPLADGEDAVAVLVAPLNGPTGRRRVAELASQAQQFSGVLSTLRLRRTLEDQATRDPLTGAVNRRQLDLALQTTLRRHSETRSPFAVVALDVDHFKRINDTFGHERGDRVLSGLGTLLRESLRGSDVIARVGGEEFVLLLRDLDAAAAAARTEALRGEIEAAHLAGPDLPCTVSFGIVPVTEEPSTGDALLRGADQALYRAKAQGRNRVCVGVPA